MNAIQTVEQPEVYDILAGQALAYLPSAGSRAVYAATYKRWAEWAGGAGVDPLAVTSANAQRFLADQDITRGTMRRQLAALRKLAEAGWVASRLNPDAAARARWEFVVEDLRRCQPPTQTGGRERERRALSTLQADKVLQAWSPEFCAQHGAGELTCARNAALLAVLLCTGARRAEAAALRWSDINFDAGTIFIAHGKGDKARDAAIFGERALQALQAWRALLPVGRVYVFCSVLKGQRFGADAPITGTDVYRIVRDTQAIVGFEFKPHDLRRTLITDLLQNAPIAEVQAQVGHARGDTTLRYAQATGARVRRDKHRLSYS